MVSFGCSVEPNLAAQETAVRRGKWILSTELLILTSPLGSLLSGISIPFISS